MTSKQSRCVVWGTVFHSLMSIVCSYAQLGVEPATRWVDAHRVPGFWYPEKPALLWQCRVWHCPAETAAGKGAVTRMAQVRVGALHLCPIRFPPRTITSEAALSCKAAGEAQIHMATCRMPQPSLGQHHPVNRGTHNNVVHTPFGFVFFLLGWGYMS